MGREGRAGTPGPFQQNPWVPDPLPRRDPDLERRVREFLAGWGPRADASDARLPDFAAAGQAAALAADELVGRIWRDARALLR